MEADHSQEFRKHLKEHLCDQVASISDDFFPNENQAGYYYWTRERWLDILYRAVELAVEIPEPDMLYSKCWLAKTDHNQISAGNCHTKPLLYNCTYVLFNPSHRDTLLARPSEENRRRCRLNSLEVSHRCGNNDCWSPYCLVLEDHGTNEDRKGCRYGALELCPHMPKCRFQRANRIVTSMTN